MAFSPDQPQSAPQLSQLGLLTAGILHEIKNPINLILNFTDICKELVNESVEESLPSQEIHENLKLVLKNLGVIKHHSAQIQEIVTNHMPSLDEKPSLFNLYEVIKVQTNLAYHTLRHRNSNFNCTIDLKGIDHSIMIKTYKSKFSLALSNLIMNALEGIETKLYDENENPAIIILVQSQQEKILIHVIDNGVGVPQENISKIFDPFFTTKPTGTGIGLSYVRAILKEFLNGEVYLESKQSVGTTATLVVPGEV